MSENSERVIETVNTAMQALLPEASNSESNCLGSGGNPLIRAGVLRPSVLGSRLNHSNSAAASTLFDAKEKEPVVNPFMKSTKDDEEPGNDSTSNEAIASSTVFGKGANSHNKDPEQNDEEQDERPDPLTLLRKNGIERANLFAAAKSSIPRVENSGFVFGQNVHERVVGENVKPDSSSKAQTADSTSGELLFSSVIQNATKTTESEEASGSAETSSNDVVTTQDNETKSLTEVAREYEESRAQKRKYEEVETFTGEEDEVNIVDISCKLFAFVNSNWEERGRGSLRLNDSKTEQGCSRVVFRTSGNLRLLLNTKVWAGMVAERPSQKSLRLTAMDNTGKIKVFLAQARPVEISLLHKALVQRIDLRKASHPGECYADTIDNNGNNNEQNATKNGAVSSTDNLSSASVQDEKPVDPKTSESDHDDSTEPSPKKSILVAEESN